MFHGPLLLVCPPGKDKPAVSLGKFMSSPKKTGSDLRLTYTEGGECRKTQRIITIMTLKCKPGEEEDEGDIEQGGWERVLF